MGRCFYPVIVKFLRETSPNSSLRSKIDFLKSTANVTFPKGHIKFGNLARFQKFWKSLFDIARD